MLWLISVYNLMEDAFDCVLFCLCSYQFNQHLMDSLCQEIQELDSNSIVGLEKTDVELDMEEQVTNSFHAAFPSRTAVNVVCIRVIKHFIRLHGWIRT